VLAAERLHGDDTTVPVLARVKPTPVDVGSTFATTSLSAASGRRRRCSITRAIAGASIRSHIWWDIPASCKPTPTTAMASSTKLTGSRAGSGGGVLGACAASVLRHGRH